MQSWGIAAIIARQCQANISIGLGTETKTHGRSQPAVARQPPPGLKATEEPCRCDQLSSLTAVFGILDSGTAVGSDRGCQLPVGAKRDAVDDAQCP